MPQTKILIVVDLQNDSCHREGAYAKNGLATSQVLKILPNIVEVLHFCKQKKIPTIATQMTILQDLDKQAMGLESIQKNYPFLETVGFRENSWGHEIIEELPNVDYKVRKWGISAFYQTELSKYLSALKCLEIILVGFTTNGAVETLAREAVCRNYSITTLTDCVGAYSEILHQASLNNLGVFGKILTSKEWISQI
jgi:ureidoacrylate peracid hydrolase